jgi:pyruvate/2-oxoglutarate dehydrogenase complex dihydrolipoamide acyltransferase (E2) component
MSLTKSRLRSEIIKDENAYQAKRRATAQVAAWKDVNATEEAKQLAAESGIDITKLTGSGQDGRIVVADVRRQLEK